MASQLPEAALTPAQLLESNAKWRSTVEEQHKRFDFKRSFEETQRPKVLWLGCVDSRVPESVVLGALPGDILVHRNIANQFPTTDGNALSVVDFAVKHLKVQHIVVAGHSACGGVYVAAKGLIQKNDNMESEDLAEFSEAEAEIEGDGKTAEPVSIPQSVINWVQPLRERIQSLPSGARPQTLAEVTKLNIRSQVDNLGKIPSVIAAGDQVQLHGWLYDLRHGTVTDVLN